MVGPDGLDTHTDAPALDHRVPKPGEELGTVRLIGELGRGAMGVVFLGYDKTLDRSVAVKVLTAGASELARRELGRFAAEASSAAAVRDPHLVQIYHADVHGEWPYLVMEYIDGPTLSRLVAHAGALSAAITIGVMTDVSGAVGRLHEHGIVHRDLKLGNVLLDRTGRAVVSDFGLAISSVKEAPAEARLAGTPAYMAPEMFEGRVSPRSDIYAMGIMIYHLLTRKVPFEGTLSEIRSQQLHNTVPLDALRAAGVTPGLLDIIERATDKQPAHRYQTAQELNGALTSLAIDKAAANVELKALIEATLRVERSSTATAQR